MDQKTPGHLYLVAFVFTPTPRIVAQKAAERT